MPGIDQQELAASYGWALSVLRSNPELSKLFNRAVQGTYNQARFVAELRNTKWYRSRGESARQALVLQKADPAEYNRRVTRAATMFSDQYFAMTGRRMDPGRAKKYGATILTVGFDEAEVRDLVGNTVKAQTLMTNYGLGGTLGEAERQMRQAAEDYGLDFSDTYFASQLNAIARQTVDPTAIVNQYRKLARSRYAAFADQIDQGVTIRDIAEPYRQLMAKTLEVSDKSIRVNDKTIQRALTYRPTTGNKAGPPTGMSLWQFEAELKNDARWDKTKGAQDQMMSAGKQVLQDMGFLGGGGS